MNENEQDFGTLRQFLKLKRYEMPPPGYFNSFSAEIIGRIRDGGKAGEFSAEAPWLMKFFQLFELKPAFAGAFASALFLLLVFGFVFADRPESAPQSLLQVNSSAPSNTFAAATPVALAQPTENTGIIATTNPAASLQPVASLFDSQNPFAQPVSFTTGN
jgi:hypothetical protein